MGRGRTIAIGIMALLLTVSMSVKGRHSSAVVSLTSIDPVGVATVWYLSSQLVPGGYQVSDALLDAKCHDSWGEA
jgi:hypothetical protein